MSWSNYTYKKSEHTERQPGSYRCIILKAEAGVSKTSGKNMLTIFLRPSGTASTVKAYIVDNDWFDSNYSSFLDAFPALKDNSNPDNCFAWRGAMGAVKLKVNDDGYFETAKYPWIPADKATRLPEFEWKARDDEAQEMPELQAFTELSDDDDSEEMPF